MTSCDIVQRLCQIDQNAIRGTLELIVTGENGRIVLRQSAKLVRWGRLLKCIGSSCVAVFAFVIFSSLFSLLTQLLIPLVLVGFGCAHWYVYRRDITPGEQLIHLEIDAQQRTIFIPIDPYRRQRHTEFDIDNIQAFYAWHVQVGAESWDVSVRCSYGKDGEMVRILSEAGPPDDADTIAQVLGFLCNKQAYKSDEWGKVHELPPPANQT